jgi:hypothetical protein
VRYLVDRSQWIGPKAAMKIRFAETFFSFARLSVSDRSSKPMIVGVICCKKTPKIAGIFAQANVGARLAYESNSISPHVSYAPIPT